MRNVIPKKLLLDFNLIGLSFKTYVLRIKALLHLRNMTPLQGSARSDKPSASTQLLEADGVTRSTKLFAFMICVRAHSISQSRLVKRR